MNTIHTIHYNCTLWAGAKTYLKPNAGVVKHLFPKIHVLSFDGDIEQPQCIGKRRSSIFWTFFKSGTMLFDLPAIVM
jgi:hypothetical protein